jgi:hypothetical protein
MPVFINQTALLNSAYINFDEQCRIMRAIEELRTNQRGGVAQDRLFRHLGRPHCFGDNVKALVEQGVIEVQVFGICDFDVRLYVADND